MGEQSHPGAERSAAIVGVGLIGGSIGIALRSAGWTVYGIEADPERAAGALERGAVSEVVDRPPETVNVTFVCTPVGAIVAAAAEALEYSEVVTDVGSVKAPIVDAIGDPRFLGGHPMAGSEQEGVAGADPELFGGAVWVVTPTADTAPATYQTVASLAGWLGAEVVALDPAAHDRVVATVSHVPHLAAATLMALAADESISERALMRLAAGGFRDMTRIAAGHPGIWPDICAANRDAITEALDRLIDTLGQTRALVADADRDGLLGVLERARKARLELTAPAGVAGELSVVRVPVPDRPGVLADVTTLATELEVNIFDVEIAHSAEGPGGVLILVVSVERSDRFVEGLVGRGYRPSMRTLE